MFAYNNVMLRRILRIAIALAIAISGYQPFLGMTAIAAPAPMEMSASTDGDCPKMIKDDCCDKADKDGKRLCQWNDSCAVRCHVNAGLEAQFVQPLMHEAPAVLLAFADPPPLHAARAGPDFRPPII